jgi:putative N6-adenine-specific DNA methylase
MQGRSIIVRKAADREVKDGGFKTNTLRRLEAIYEGIGDFFKKTGGGYRGYIFTGNLDMIKKIGLRTKRRLIFYNGEIECRLLEYELYAGSLKRHEPDHKSI